MSSLAGGRCSRWVSWDVLGTGWRETELLCHRGLRGPKTICLESVLHWTAEPPKLRADLGVSPASPPGESRAVELLLLPSTCPSPGAQVGKSHGPGTARPQGRGFAVCPSAGATGHPSDLPPHSGCFTADEAVRNVIVLKSGICYRNANRAGHGERSCRGQDKEPAQRGFQRLAGQLPSPPHLAEDSAQPAQAAPAPSLVSCPQQ